MYNLGEQFEMNHELALMNQKQIIRGQKYRITVLTERLLRLEYSETGNFLDAPTNQIWYRALPECKYDKREDNTYLEIETDYLKLYYTKEKPFYGGKVNPMSNLKVELKIPIEFGIMDIQKYEILELLVQNFQINMGKFILEKLFILLKDLLVLMIQKQIF